MTPGMNQPVVTAHTSLGKTRITADLRDGPWPKVTIGFPVGMPGDQKEAASLIPVDYSVPQFGGRRWWFLCPQCGYRCLRLYLPPYVGGSAVSGDSNSLDLERLVYTWACRRCLKLLYYTQCVTKRDRLERKAMNLCIWLDTWERAVPRRRPAGMRRRTFHRLCARLADTLERLARLPTRRPRVRRTRPLRHRHPRHHPP